VALKRVFIAIATITRFFLLQQRRVTLRLSIDDIVDYAVSCGCLGISTQASYQ